MKSLKYIIILVLSSWQLLSCDFIEKATTTDSTPTDKLLASAGGENLYYSEVKHQMGLNLSRQDSSDLMYRIVHKWIKSRLLLEQANERDIDFDEIDARVKELREELVIYELRKSILNEDSSYTDISEEAILEYYNENKKEFDLKQNIVRGKFVVVPKEASDINDLKKWLKKNDTESLQELNNYCLRSASKYYLDDSLWFSFDDISGGSPLQDINDQERFLKYTTFSETSDSLSYYYLTISDYKIKGETAPLNFHRDRIRNILILKKKKEKIKQYEDKLFKEARSSEEFEIYN